MYFARIYFTLIAICLFTPCSVHAGVVFGVFGVQTDNVSQTVANQIITGQGHTVQALSDLSGTSLTGIDVLWVMNAGSAQPTELTTTYKSAVSNFVTNGGVFLYHDEAVADAQNALPGASFSTFSFDAIVDANDINVFNSAATVTNGPGGSITDSTLDNGSPSSRGYANGALLPNGATAILNRGSSNDVVDFHYGYGNGFVYYSTIPLDHHLAGTSDFAKVYAPNVVEHVAMLEPTGGSAVPEPASVLLFAAGLSITTIRRFRKANAETLR